VAKIWILLTLEENVEEYHIQKELCTRGIKGEGARPLQKLHLFVGVLCTEFLGSLCNFLLDRTKRTPYEERRAWCNMSLIAFIINSLIIPTLNINFSPIQNNCLFAAKLFHCVNKFKCHTTHTTGKKGFL
jgi:hypothetical protein